MASVPEATPTAIAAPQIGGERLLEPLDLLAEDVAPAVQNARDRGEELVAIASRDLPREVDERDAQLVSSQ